jgi:lipopolysaccharide biosynthesis glycosyltransferase
VRTVALFADRRILPGLHATLASLFAHAADTPPFRVVVFGEALPERATRVLAETVAPVRGAHGFEVRPFVLPALGRAKSLRGNYTTYGRLFLPELLPDAETCVYLDCDLIVTRPVDGLFALGDRPEPLHAEATGVRRDSLDRPTFAALGLDLDRTYFNCGVLVFNLARWRTEALTARCLAVADEHGDQLLSADQTVLNIVFGESVGAFGSEFNTFLWPSTAPVLPGEAQGRIWHFVGAPKPWDYFGSYANRNAGLWRRWASQTAWRADWRGRAACYWSVRQRARILPAVFREALRRV